MPILLIVNSPAELPWDLPDVEIMTARDYLTRPDTLQRKGLRIFNLCRSMRYQSLGYYVSLLAEARGHKPIPSITTIQDIKTQSLIRLASDEHSELINRSLSTLKSDTFTMSIYFGKNLAKRYDTLAGYLFRHFQAPLLRAEFSRQKTQGQNGDAIQPWTLTSIEILSPALIPENHHDFAAQQAKDYFTAKRFSVRKKRRYRYDLAILHNPQEKEAPSDPIAIKKFIKAADELDIATELITRDDYSRIGQFDALFIRETTAVNHHTYRFARRAQAEGLVVVDDPLSILRCTNKVYLAELLERHKISIPKTTIISKDNLKEQLAPIALPCILKQPDSAFSQGVIKVDTPEELRQEAERLLQKSALLIIQEFLPTAFDWRIGIFDGRPLYACKYHMARKHWQIIARDQGGSTRYGKHETLPVEMVPPAILKTALRAASLIGTSLYGVDLKEIDGTAYIIEVNDNPNIDSAIEDAMLKDELYRRIMSGFLHRIDNIKAGRFRA